MGKPTPWKDEYTLLCERCGYVIEDLDTSGACPECGKPIRESLPSARTGTPMQNTSSRLAQVLSIPKFLSSPRRWYAQARIDEGDGTRLIFSNVMLSSVLGVLLSLCALMLRGLDGSVAMDSPFPPWQHAIALLGSICVSAASLWGLIALEAAGLRFFGGKRGWRITRAVSYTVVAHAAPAWTLGVAGFWLGLTNPTLIEPLTNLVLRAGIPILLPPDVILAAFFGFLPGMLLFETIVYIGVRQNRYANIAATPDTRDRKAASPA